MQKWICHAISSDISGNANRRVTFKIYMLREAKRIAKEVGADFRKKWIKPFSKRFDLSTHPTKSSIVKELCFSSSLTLSCFKQLKCDKHFGQVVINTSTFLPFFRFTQPESPQCFAHVIAVHHPANTTAKRIIFEVRQFYISYCQINCRVHRERKAQRVSGLAG